MDWFCPWCSSRHCSFISSPFPEPCIYILNIYWPCFHLCSQITGVLGTHIWKWPKPFDHCQYYLTICAYTLVTFPQDTSSGPKLWSQPICHCTVMPVISWDSLMQVSWWSRVFLEASYVWVGKIDGEWPPLFGIKYNESVQMGGHIVQYVAFQVTYLLHAAIHPLLPKKKAYELNSPPYYLLSPEHPGS